MTAMRRKIQMITLDQVTGKPRPMTEKELRDLNDEWDKKLLDALQAEGKI